MLETVHQQMHCYLKFQMHLLAFLNKILIICFNLNTQYFIYSIKTRFFILLSKHMNLSVIITSKKWTFDQ